MTAIFLASQCEFSRFTDKPVEENGYQDIKCYNMDDLLPLHQVALSLWICLLQGREGTGCFCGSSEGVRGGWGRRGDTGGSRDPEVGHGMQTWRQSGGDLKPSSGGRLALSRSFFPREAKVGETVPTQSPVLGKASEERVRQGQKQASRGWRLCCPFVHTSQALRKDRPLGLDPGGTPFPGVSSQLPVHLAGGPRGGGGVLAAVRLLLWSCPA